VRRRHWLLLTLAVASVLIAGGMASGYWSAPGGGSGSAATGLSSSMTLSPGQPVDDLFPGDTGDVAVTATNPNAYAVHIGTLELDPTTGAGGYGVDAEHGACPVAVLTFAAQTNSGSGWTVPAASGGVEGTLAIDLTEALTMTVDAPVTCQGAAFVVHLVPVP